MKIDIYYRSYRISTETKYIDYFFVKNKKAILKIGCCYYNDELVDRCCNTFGLGIPLNRLKQQINITKLELYEFIFNDSINILFNESSEKNIRFMLGDEFEAKEIFLILKKYFNNIKGE